MNDLKKREEDCPTFSACEGANLREVPMLAKVFDVANLAIQKLRTSLGYGEIPMNPSHVRLIHHREWHDRIARSKRKRVRNAIGIYELSEHAIFLPYPQQERTRIRAAKVLVHEMVHYASEGGVDKYSEIVNEGMTERYAVRLFLHDVGSPLLQMNHDPYPMYLNEQKISRLVDSFSQDARKSLHHAFWNANGSLGKKAIEGLHGEGFAALLEGSDKTKKEVREMLESLADKFLGSYDSEMHWLLRDRLLNSPSQLERCATKK